MKEKAIHESEKELLMIEKFVNKCLVTELQNKLDNAESIKEGLYEALEKEVEENRQLSMQKEIVERENRELREEVEWLQRQLSEWRTAYDGVVDTGIAYKAGLDKIITEAEYFKQWCKDKRPQFTGMGAPIALLDIVIEQGKQLINNKK